MSWLVKLVREGVNLDLIWRQKQPLLVHYKVGKQSSFVFIHTLYIMEVVCKQKICWGCFYSLHLEFLFTVCNTGWSKIFNQIWIVFPNALYICMNIEIQHYALLRLSTWCQGQSREDTNIWDTSYKYKYLGHLEFSSLTLVCLNEKLLRLLFACQNWKWIYHHSYI